MKLTPYRITPPRPAELPIPQSTGFGHLRSVHTSPPLWRWLLPPAIVSSLLLITALFVSEGKNVGVVLIGMMFSSFWFYFAGWRLVRARAIEVRLHTGGVEVVWPRARERIAFDDVDEVRLALVKQNSDRGEYAAFQAVHLVDHDGRRVSVPANVEGSVELFHGILEATSLALIPAALIAFERGDRLTFGRIAIDKSFIHINDQSVAWADIEVVRFDALALVFFRRESVLSWKEIRLDEIPHPSVFMHLVTVVAPRIRARHLAFPPERPSS